jgi:hypothetical protein
LSTVPAKARQESAEKINEPNHRLHEKWEHVFPLILGFESCLCLQRVRCPQRSLDMDFFLLDQAKPALGVVECEGRTHRVPQGVEQLLSYVGWFVPYKGDGERILEVSIRDALESKKKRATVNSAGYGGVQGWISQSRSRVTGEAELVALLSQASHRIVPILLYYRDEPLTSDEQRILGLAFRSHDFFAGTIDTGSWSLTGRYL